MTLEDDAPPDDEREPRPEWERYERLIARLLVEQASTELCVTANARVRGRISGAVRQVDVLIDARHDTDNSHRVIVDAKRRQRKIDVKDVEAFEGFMRDVGAAFGYLVSTTGYTKAAEHRSQDAIRISIIPLEHIEQVDPSRWPHCVVRRCERGRVFWDGFPKISMGATLVPAESGERLEIAWVYYVGKCDRCGAFHVYCETCRQLFSCADDEGEHQCGCEMPWFWMASVERANDGELSAELHWVSIQGPITVDRRPYSKRR